MENLNAETVKRGLERCAKEWHCGLCVFTENECALIKKSAIALITEQEQRIGELAAENERLRGTRYMLDQDGRIEMIPTIDRVRADTVRKMQERLKADAITIKDHTGKFGVVVGVGNIDDVAREMLEGEDG